MPKHAIIHKRTIKEIRELVRNVHVKGGGASAEFKIERLGFAVLLEPGYDLFFIGEANPGFKPVQQVELILSGLIE